MRPGSPAMTMNPLWIPVLQNLRAKGIKVGVLTNNFWIDRAKTRDTNPLDKKYFDEIFESCRLGMRKPDPKIFHFVLEKLKV
uniref:Epoxide hydrolase n=1 Tax=Acrobeloides nanus TaxID=290746 RepID=A0A914E8N6_9BILA